MTDHQPRPLTELVQVEPFPRPNIVLVVLDCVSEAAISALRGDGTGPKFPQGLSAELVSFPRSVSASSWTLPSHASLLTALPPWEHGVHGRGSLRLGDGTPTLAEELRQSGYATACISSNGFLGPASGLTRGFQTSHIGGWSETVSRVGRRDTCPNQYDDTTSSKEPETEEQGLELAAIIRRVLMRYPGYLDAPAKVLHRVAHPGQPFTFQVSPWVETSFRRWVSGVEPEKPLFCLINYLDAHEPYYYEGSAVRTHNGWLRYSRTSQDQTDYLVHPELTRAAPVKMLQELYLGRVRYLLQRLGRLIEVLKEANRWEDTLLIVTSDHGQAFGSSGAMFHGLSIDDSVARVPLWVRFPGGRSGGSVCETWTSALDVAETVRACARAGPTGLTSGGTGRSLPRSVSCISDGVVNLSVMARFPDETRARVDHVLVAIYTGDQKLHYDACHDRFEGAVDTSGENGDGADWAREIGSKMLKFNSPRVDHLAAWGY